MPIELSAFFHATVGDGDDRRQVEAVVRAERDALGAWSGTVARPDGPPVPVPADAVAGLVSLVGTAAAAPCLALVPPPRP